MNTNRIHSSALDTCRFTRPPTRQFDLTPLHRTTADYYARSPNGNNQFYFNLCGTAIDPNCRSNNGACLTSRNNSTSWKSIGKVDNIEIDVSNEDVDPVTVFYRMRGTDTCPLSGSPRSFDIKLICSRYNNGTIIQETKPRFIQELDKCSYQFEMITRFACPESNLTNIVPDTSCSYLNGHYQISSLRNTISNYRLETDKDVFWLNFCGNIVPNYIDGSKGCPSDAAVCALTKDNVPPIRSNLGSKGLLGFDDDGVLALTYKDGQECIDGIPRTTVIRFPCTSSLTGDNGGFKVIEGHTACGKTVFEFPSRVGCDISTLGIGAGGIIGWIIFSFIIVYIIARMAYNYIKLDLRGFELIPHIDAIINGIEWVHSKLRRRTGRIRI